MERRPLGRTGLQVSPVAFGCWPIAGMTSLGVSEAESRATLAHCPAVGVNFFDTAFCYGADGESERMLGEALRAWRREEVVVATKGGVHWEPDGARGLDARPAVLRRQCEISLRRLGLAEVDLYYLHAPDPRTPLAESAGALLELRQAGKIRAVGASNLSVDQLAEFHAVCPLDAYQPPYNLLQRDIERDALPWCREYGVAVVPYWPLLKGLLAGRLTREHDFVAGDGRPKYPMFQGEEWLRNQDFLDELRSLAAELGKSVAQVSINWLLTRDGVAAALCGAKRREQLIDNAGAMGWRLAPEHLARIDAALARRGAPASRWAV